MFKRLLTIFSTTAAAAAPLVAPAPKVTPHAELIYPYVVPKEYLQHGPTQPDGITRTLGHDLFIVLVHDLDGLVQNVLPDDLKKLGLTPEQAQKQADSNLAALIKEQKVHSSVFASGPQGKPFALFGGHWAAAASSTWTGLYAALSKALGSGQLIVSIPHREAMLVFPDGGPAYLEAMKAIIREKEADGAKLLTWNLFDLTKDGLKPRKNEG